ncbi:unnamed protein product [Spodoptera littoralis]|uniref:Uncharacterized protein n=1 Tax=Spodoptera littoralis TaxID=7109 RepID=A0A9P0I1K1_SPOLI|nr:unnamed protein product [Spodoptera littoralis]CAH1638114.1 unnamed protein product [Spodoptera littoralis]
MTDQEKDTGATPAGGSKVVMVEQTTMSSHKPYRPTDLQDDASGELHHKRSRAPAVPSVAEEFKDTPESAEIKEQLESTKGSECGISVDKINNIEKKVSSTISKKRPSTPEAIPLAPIEVEVKKTEILASPTLHPVQHPVQPIPPGLGSKASEVSDLPDKKETEGKEEEDSITGEIAELRTPDPTQKSTEWSDEEEAGGLPRSDSRASRVSRAVRQLFCCGVPYDAPSEENDTENHSQNKVPENQETEGAVPLQRKLASETIRKSGNELENEDISGIQHIERNSERKSKSETINQCDLNTRNTRSTWDLERKASIGPCYKKTLPFGEPSGISIFLPKKSSKSIKEDVTFVKSGISLILSKKNFETKEFELPKDSDKISRKKNHIDIKVNNIHIIYLIVEEGQCDTIFGNIKGKLEYLRGRIKHALHM